MGFFEPSPPPFDLEEWKAKPHLTRLKPLVQDWGAERVRLADLRLLHLRHQAGRLQRRGAVRDLADAGARLGSATSATGGRSRSSSRSWLSGCCSGRSWGSEPGRCRSASGSYRRSAACSTGCGPGRCGCHPGRIGCRSRKGRPALARRRAIRGGARAGVFLLAASGVDSVAGFRGQAASGGNRGAARAARAARPPRQGVLPRRPARDLRDGPGRRALPGPALDRGLAVRLPVHLVGSCVLEAQPATSRSSSRR